MDKIECFVCVVQNYWARGKSVDDAKRQVYKLGGSVKKCVVYHVVGDREAKCSPVDGGLLTLPGAVVTTVEVKGFGDRDIKLPKTGTRHPLNSMSKGIVRTSVKLGGES